MPDIRPTWVELESVIPLEAEPGATSVKTVTTLSADTIRREYADKIVQVSPRRQAMKLRHALEIAGSIIKRSPRVKIPRRPETGNAMVKEFDRFET